jgi:hypothetical protein
MGCKGEEMGWIREGTQTSQCKFCGCTSVKSATRSSPPFIKNMYRGIVSEDHLTMSSTAIDNSQGY